MTRYSYAEQLMNCPRHRLRKMEDYHDEDQGMYLGNTMRKR